MIRLRPGQSLVEVLIAVAIFVLATSTIGVLFFDAARTHVRNSDSVSAEQYATEGIEAVRTLRDDAFSNLTAGTYGLSIIGNQWTLSGTSDTQDGYTRTISISAPDANTRYVTSTVTWISNNQPATTTSFAIFTDWPVTTAVAPAGWATAHVVATTTLPNSRAALSVDVDVSRKLLYLGTAINSIGPEFLIYDITSSTSPVFKGSWEANANVNTIAASGTLVYIGDSANHVRIINTSTPTAPILAGTITLQGSSAAINGIALDKTNVHAVCNANGSKSTYQIWNAANPAAAIFLGGLNAGNGVNDIALKPSVTWAFLAGQMNTQELQDVNYSNPASMGVGGSVNLSGNEDMNAMAVSGTIAYGGSLIRAASGEFFTFNISTPTAPTSLGAVDIGASINRVRLWPTTDNTVFAATASSSNQFMVFDVTTSTSPVILDTVALAGTANDLAVTTSTAYIATASTAAGLQIVSQ